MHTSKTPRIIVPPDLAKAFRTRPRLARYFRNLPLSERQAYLTWIADGKKEATRRRRIAVTIKKLEVLVQ